MLKRILIENKSHLRYAPDSKQKTLLSMESVME